MTHKTARTTETEPTLPPTAIDATSTMVLTPGTDEAVVAAVPASRAPAPGSQTPDAATEEHDIWAGRYSLRNFVGRAIFRALLTIAWLGLAGYTWLGPEPRIAMFQMSTILAGVAVLLLWGHLVLVILRARWGHYYHLTNRRLFIGTGIFRHRRDQVELIKVKDVFVRQYSLIQRWLDVGTVVIESSEERFPTTYLLGVDHPDQVMDLIWRTTRREREGTAVQVEAV